MLHYTSSSTYTQILCTGFIESYNFVLHDGIQTSFGTNDYHDKALCVVQESYR